MDVYTIGQLAGAANVPTSTVRFYERAGLLKPEFRTGANYRGYGRKALEQLRFIRSTQATGFRLADILELMRLTSSDESPCVEVASLLSDRLADVRERLKELRHIERVLTKSLRGCCSGADQDLCGEIIKMQGRPRAGLTVRGKSPGRT